MSDIQLTPDLLDDLQRVVETHDEQAKENQVVTIQYLAAVVALMTARFPTGKAEKEDILDQLHGLMRHVLSEQADSGEGEGAGGGQAVPEGKTEETGPATGVWRPS